ncbi:MAG: tetratricopeptide repeat protein [Alphaproteobacteria bacterium]
MKNNRLGRTAFPLGLAGAAVIALAAGIGLSPAAVVAKPAPDKIAAQVRQALGNGQTERAIQLGEKLVGTNPREPGYRAILGQAYLRAGRFESAAQALDDAMKLGDNAGRTALGLALANAGTGRGAEASAVLTDWRDAIPAADLGLAYAMAGDADRGVAILVQALRGGENTPKLRQNLAYAYALGGRWREARIMAAQDIPADQLDARISKWASRAKPEDRRLRVAALLGAPLRSDTGMPARLALAPSSEQQQLAAESAAQRTGPAVATSAELPPFDNAPVQGARNPLPAEPAVASGPGAPVFAESPVIQRLPSLPGKASLGETGQPKATLAAEKVANPKGPTHAIQLGSFASEQGARRAWGQYVARNPELRGLKMVVTNAQVRGKTYWRVAAGGFDARRAGGLCAKVKARGGVCFAYATTGKPALAPAYAGDQRATTPVIALSTGSPVRRR